MRQQQEAISKRISDNSLQIITIKASNQAIRKSLAAVTLRIDEVNKVMVAITESLKTIPSPRELRQHQCLMEDQMAQVEDINTGLTTALEIHKVSDSTPT